MRRRGGGTRSKLTRREFLSRLGAGVAVASADPLVVRPTAASTASTPSPVVVIGRPSGASATSGAVDAGAAASGVLDAGRSADPVPVLALDEIQGNILGGLGTARQAAIGLRFAGRNSGRAWVGELASLVTSIRDRADADPADQARVWVNVAFTHAGLRALGAPGLRAFPEAFRSGMAARASVLGDVGPSSPANWAPPFRRSAHALVIVAGGSAEAVAGAVAGQLERAGKRGFGVAFVQHGADRDDEPGHEHFGFRDGISQPAVHGFAPSSPGQSGGTVVGPDPVWPGEFVLGYPTQEARSSRAGPIAVGGPQWSANGSFLVFRRLRQDVAGFRAFIANVAKNQGITEDLAGAKIVGRYRSGAPLKRAGDQAQDPGRNDPTVLAAERINDFGYADDPDGVVVPLASHLRKTFPRDEPTSVQPPDDPQIHRMIRRGIPFGPSLPQGTPPDHPLALAGFPDDRGLLFLCYQSSIERQFEFVQKRWANDPDFPRAGAGEDLLVSQTDGPKRLRLARPGGRVDHIALMQRFVVTTGGDYFFQPSISALRLLGRSAV